MIESQDPTPHPMINVVRKPVRQSLRLDVSGIDFDVGLRRYYDVGRFTLSRRTVEVDLVQHGVPGLHFLTDAQQRSARDEARIRGLNNDRRGRRRCRLPVLGSVRQIHVDIRDAPLLTDEQGLIGNLPHTDRPRLKVRHVDGRKLRSLADKTHDTAKRAERVVRRRISRNLRHDVTSNALNSAAFLPLVTKHHDHDVTVARVDPVMRILGFRRAARLQLLRLDDLQELLLSHVERQTMQLRIRLEEFEAVRR